jgi:hypothetical protein
LSAKFFLVLALLLGFNAAMARTPEEKSLNMPQEVHDWLERYETCEHFGGEVAEGSVSRAITLQLYGHQACFGILEEHRLLKRRYATNKRVLNSLTKVDVSWLGEPQNLPNLALIQIEELVARAEICKEVKNDLENMKSEENSLHAAQAYGEMCLTINKDRRVLLQQHAKDRKAIKKLNTIMFNP